MNKDLNNIINSNKKLLDILKSNRSEIRQCERKLHDYLITKTHSLCLPIDQQIEKINLKINNNLSKLKEIGIKSTLKEDKDSNSSNSCNNNINNNNYEYSDEYILLSSSIDETDYQKILENLREFNQFNQEDKKTVTECLKDLNITNVDIKLQEYRVHQSEHELEEIMRRISKSMVETNHTVIVSISKTDNVIRATLINLLDQKTQDLEFSGQSQMATKEIYVFNDLENEIGIIKGQLVSFIFERKLYILIINNNNDNNDNNKFIIIDLLLKNNNNNNKLIINDIPLKNNNNNNDIFSNVLACCADDIDGLIFIYYRDHSFIQYDIKAKQVKELRGRFGFAIDDDTYLSMVYNRQVIFEYSNKSTIYLLGGQTRGNYIYSIKDNQWYRFYNSDTYNRDQQPSLLIYI
ncbi:hypothetical protein PPL_09337 [Heterostelium album PN500]|uniref:Uncharacterized protein n=1 Tax=Heterostelium pallidum (strain ATCC 26659 / Pp 5 / PN500) TaxID=670386 RepID=D3BLA5_HETP5|nr:hypothetical protein PPL_09337 [Heterostelium album PN500]EFA77839.1 hypothetical protein PPL_09337 [Heterostelium album PN500]|eukprot:XP_020429967.1 hypothetical protein PPL_09337 [Heterostelium album PN500]